MTEKYPNTHDFWIRFEVLTTVDCAVHFADDVQQLSRSAGGSGGNTKCLKDIVGGLGPYIPLSEFR
jgi:hypothetical protein